MENQVQPPRYIRIALDVAHRICNDEFKENDKIRGRSTLAGEYNVSPETIRRAAAILSDMGVVEVSPNSGIYIKSQKNASDFIQKFSTKESISVLKSNLKNLIDQKNSIDKEIEKNIDSIIEYSLQLKNTGLIHHYEYEIPEKSAVIGNSLAKLQFWQNTGATIIGVYRDNELVVSPGPYFELYHKDKIVFVGTDDVHNRVKRFID